MGDLIWLSDAQMRRIEPCFPLSHGVPRVDDRKVISGIIFVIRNGLRWRDAPKEYGPHKTIYNRFVRWSRLGVFNKIFAQLASKGPRPERLMIDATCLILAFDGAIFSLDWREALWARFYTGAPRRQRQSVEQYKIVKRA